MSLQNDLSTICFELRSDKHPIRNKAMERLVTILEVSKEEILCIFDTLRGKNDSESVTGPFLFNRVVEATVRHASELENIKNERTLQTQRNKNSIYSSIVMKLIDYNLEAKNAFLQKSTILSALFHSIEEPSVVVHFAELLFRLLDRGIYLSPDNVLSLKVNEYSRILSYLFQLNAGELDVNSHLALLNTINRTIEIAVEHVHIHDDLIAYLPQLRRYAVDLINERCRSQVIRMFYIYVTQLSIDYHYTICVELQRLLPIIASFYTFDMRNGKELLFQSVNKLLSIIYPNADKNDFNTFGVPLADDWRNSMQRLHTIVDIECREQSARDDRLVQVLGEDYVRNFVRMASRVEFLIYWHFDEMQQTINTAASKRKIAKLTDKLELLMEMKVFTNETKCNRTWLAIVADIMTNYTWIINLSNVPHILELMLRILQQFGNVTNLHNIRKCLLAILNSGNVNNEYCRNEWERIVKCLIASTSTATDEKIIQEHHLLLQAIIVHGKMDNESSVALLHSIISSHSMRRNECIETVRQMLIHTDTCGIEKTGEHVARTLSWLHEHYGKLEARNVLLNIAPIDSDLIADVSAIATINFLNVNQSFTTPSSLRQGHIALHSNFELLTYKYNRKFVCLDRHGHEILKSEQHMNQEDSSEFTKEGSVQDNCLFQTNYELLMRLLNFETSTNTELRDICSDLNLLMKMARQMRTLLAYGVFTIATYEQCPLIKRIGFFLSHLEYQVKSQQISACHPSDLVDILQRLSSTFGIFVSNPVLLHYLETQPLEELIGFLESLLKFSVIQQSTHKNDNSNEWNKVANLTLRTLATLCASGTHFEDIFKHIVNHSINIESDLPLLIELIKLFCNHNAPKEHVADWFLVGLKVALKHYYTHIDVMVEIVPMLPGIFSYVHTFENPMRDMLVALHSLLKVAFRKSYPRQLTVTLINNIRNILRECHSTVEHEDFANICLSVVKFLQFPDFEVQLATVNVISSMLDTRWVVCASQSSHLTFSNKIYNHIQLKDLLDGNADLTQNRIAVTVQTLIAVFVFGSYFQQQVLTDLISFIYDNKKNTAEFCRFDDIVKFLHCSIDQITKPYIEELIVSWIAKERPIDQFPYYICAGTLDEFVKKHIRYIVITLLLYHKNADLKTLFKYKSQNELVQLALPIARSLLIVRYADCPEANTSDYKQKLDVLLANLNALGCKTLKRTDCILPDSDGYVIVHYIMSRFHDSACIEKLTKTIVFMQPTVWNSLSSESIMKCLSFLTSEGQQRVSTSMHFFKAFVEKNAALHFLRSFGTFKTLIVECFNPVDSVKYLSIMCGVANIMLDQLPLHEIAAANNQLDQIQNCVRFIVRDVISFTVMCLLKAREAQMQQTALQFIRHFLSKPLTTTGYCMDVIRIDLNDIFKALVRTAEKAFTTSIEAIVFDLMRQLIIRHKDNIILLDAVPQHSKFNGMHQLLRKEQETQLANRKMDEIVNAFISADNYSVEGIRAIRNFISKNKSQLPDHNKVIYDLIKNLLETVRKSMSKHVREEALQALGEIGSVHIEGIAYCFQHETTLYADDEDCICDDPIEEFVSCISKCLNKLLCHFKSTFEPLLVLMQMLVNSKFGNYLSQKYPALTIFQQHHVNNSFGTSQISAGVINWKRALANADATTYEEWLCSFVANILSDCGWTEFQHLAKLEVVFAEAVLVPFIQSLLRGSGQAEHVTALSAVLDEFFGNFAASQKGSSQTNPLSADNRNGLFREKRIIIQMLNICECIRIHNNWHVPVQTLNVVEACNYCQASFMSIIYLEQWASAERTASRRQRLQSKSAMISNTKLRAQDCYQTLAKKAYESVGCRDEIAGFIDPLKSRLHFLELNNNWADILLEATPSDIISDSVYTYILKRNGMLSLANMNQSNGSNSSSQKSIDYELLWRLGQWDVPVTGHAKVDTLNDMETEFQKHHYNALKCLGQREQNNCLAALTNARQCVMAILREISVECLQSVYKYLTWLQLLQQVEDFCQVQFLTVGGNASGSSIVSEILKKWKTVCDLQYGSFQCKDTIVAHQVALFQMAGLRAKHRINAYYKETNPIANCLLTSVSECRRAGEMNLAKQRIAALRQLPIEQISIKTAILLEDADISCRTGNPQITQAILHNLLRVPELQKTTQYVTAMRMYGEYLMESNMENFETVLRKYFQPTLANGSSDNDAGEIASNQAKSNALNVDEKNRRESCAVIAKYADQEYVQLNTFILSEDFQMKCRIIEQNRQMAGSVERNSNDRDKKYSAIQMTRFAYLDEKEVISIEDKRTDNLCIALEHYMRFCSLDNSSASTAAIYRIIGLWFANKHNDRAHAIVAAHISIVPSYKFICALNQMTARLISKDEEFLIVLKSLLVRCLQDHPQQTLLQLLPQIFSGADSKRAETEDSSCRINNARQIIQRGTNNNNSKLIKQLEIMFPVLIEFANFEHKTSQRLGLGRKFASLKNLSDVHCLTMELPVSPSNHYNITYVVKWLDEVTLVGGLNAPKKVKCLCSDGVIRPQLLKGKDDMRQDAVMQQLFGMINKMLTDQPEAVERHLQLRTYKVVPLAQRSGILEWCNNAIPIGVYLRGTSKDNKNGAHQRYHPHEWSPFKCQAMATPHLKSDLSIRHRIYTEICNNMSPVFHYFLLEKFHVPGVWFERRLAYTNSVAITSMVGFILGLGDRHSQNILIDEKTAEVIHIDFGIAFEQGRIMPTPEMVPFRLTRDMVAPMGICETNGVFKKSSECTMRILRSNRAVITTILEVLLYDPLYMWNVLPQLATSSNNDNDYKNNYKEAEEQNVMAQRALLCVQNKLEGKQVGTLGPSEVHVQVQRLINEAISSVNLCQMFHGWDPYM